MLVFLIFDLHDLERQQPRPPSFHFIGRLTGLTSPISLQRALTRWYPKCSTDTQATGSSATLATAITACLWQWRKQRHDSFLADTLLPRPPPASCPAAPWRSCHEVDTWRQGELEIKTDDPLHLCPKGSERHCVLQRGVRLYCCTRLYMRQRDRCIAFLPTHTRARARARVRAHSHKRTRTLSLSLSLSLSHTHTDS